MVTWTLFLNRREAGRALGAKLASLGTSAGIVLGLTRGGVPVAYEVALALGARLDIIVVKKIGSPMTPELALGAVCSDGTIVRRTEAVRDLGVSDEYVQHEADARSAEARAAEERYRGGCGALDLTGARVIVVDDGIATGASMEAACLSARNRGASTVTVATPVSPPHAQDALARVADGFVSLLEPEEFWAVGQFYEDFSQVADDEVRSLLARARSGATRVGRA